MKLSIILSAALLLLVSLNAGAKSFDMPPHGHNQNHSHHGSSGHHTSHWHYNHHYHVQYFNHSHPSSNYYAEGHCQRKYDRCVKHHQRHPEKCKGC